VSEIHAGTASHNHETDEVQCLQRHLNWKLRVAATASSDSPKKILSEQLKTVPAEYQGALTSVDNSRRYIQLQREGCGLPKFSATTRDQLPCLTGIFKTESGEDFLKYDSGPSSDRIIIFSTTSNLTFLQQSSMWFADGTFKTSPILFEQLYIICGLRINGTDVGCFPAVYCLTPNRTSETYRRIFKKLLELNPHLAPACIMTDFERAAMVAYNDVFPNAERKGCFFHFRQANKRKIQGMLIMEFVISFSLFRFALLVRFCYLPMTLFCI